jgi:hypothetical protein
MILTRLSMLRAPRMGRKMPHVPTPEQRVREYRRHAPVQFGNARFCWPDPPTPERAALASFLRVDFADLTDLRALARAIRKTN